MREKLFRGKRIDNGEWVYGYYVEHITRQVCVIGDDKLKDDEILYLIAEDGFADWNMPKQLNFTKVIKDTIGQYTGLKDKEGVKIFEGDLVKCRDSNDEVFYTSYVTFSEGAFIVDVVGCEYDYTVLGWALINGDIVDDDIEVIGSVHDSEVE